MSSDKDLNVLSVQLGERLLARHMRMATVESCTGGWIAKCMTDVPGSSAWFERGFVTYSNEAKQDLVGVKAETLAGHGAVSAAVVREMAAGGLARSNADHCVAVSGVAGPGGGTTEKPVGLVWLAWARKDGEITVSREQFSGDREAVRRQTVVKALQGLLDGLG